MLLACLGHMQLPTRKACVLMGPSAIVLLILEWLLSTQMASGWRPHRGGGRIAPQITKPKVPASGSPDMRMGLNYSGCTENSETGGPQGGPSGGPVGQAV